MADLGVIGTDSRIAQRSYPHGAADLLRGMRLMGCSRIIPISERNDTEGYATGPSLDIHTLGNFRFRWSVDAGARTITIFVKHPSDLTPRPSLTVKANPAIGVNADVSATAPSGVGWVQIGPVAIAPTSDGAVWVEIANNTDRHVDHCYFDHIQTT